MFKRFLIGLLIVFFAVPAHPQRPNPISPDGRFRGIFLGGRVAVVSEPSPDVIRVKVVYSWNEANLLVAPHNFNEVRYEIGQWQFVSYNPAFRIIFVSEDEDIRIMFTDHVWRYSIDNSNAMLLPLDKAKSDAWFSLPLEERRQRAKKLTPYVAP